MNSLEIDKTYSRHDLQNAGFTCFPAKVPFTSVYIKEGAVYFFSHHGEDTDEMRLIHLSTL